MYYIICHLLSSSLSNLPVAVHGTEGLQYFKQLMLLILRLVLFPPGEVVLWLLKERRVGPLNPYK